MKRRFPMKLSRMLSVAIVLVLAWTTVAAAAILRTAPFPGDVFGNGAAACYVTNTSANAGTVSATLYGMTGAVLESLSGVTLAGHATTVTTYHSLADSPTHCVCVVPSTGTYRCSFVYVDKDVPLTTVIGAP
jgi:hypothetical protein